VSATSEKMGGKQPDDGAASHGPQNTGAVIRRRRSTAGAWSVAKGGKRTDVDAAWSLRHWDDAHTKYAKGLLGGPIDIEAGNPNDGGAS